MPSFERLNRRYGPWISLALGVAAVVYVRRGLGFAPAAVAVMQRIRLGRASRVLAAPAPGRWWVDLRTDSSQLIARESFVVR